MKKALLTVAVVCVATAASAAQIVEAIVLRVGDRIVTRTQYDRRLHDGYAEIEQTSQPADVAGKKTEFRKNLVNDLIGELLIKDLAALATTASEAGTRSKGGDLGEVARGELLPDLDKSVFNSTSGAVIGPIESKSGWHIIKVEQRLPSEVPAFESVKEKLRKDATDDAWQRDYKAYIDRLRKDAFIQINEANVPTD